MAETEAPADAAPGLARDEAGVADSVRLQRLLLAVACEKDKGAFAELFRSFAPRLAAYCQRLGAPPAQAQEIAQEAMLAVWRRADSFDPAAGTASAWIFAIGRNRFIDRFRGELRPEPDISDPAMEIAAPRTPEEEALEADQVRNMAAALKLLPSEQSEVLRLAYYEHRSQTDIAEMLGVPLGTVKSRTRLALKRMRELMETCA